MHGQMEVMVNDIMEARKNSSHMVGLGIISEAQYDNPVMYDLIFDLAWASDDFDLNTWLNSYIERRYGGTSQNAKMAWQIMKESVAIVACPKPLGRIPPSWNGSTA